MNPKSSEKPLKIGFDLDGVFCGKPPFMPKRLLEWLFKGSRKGLHYRFPNTELEKKIRQLSHFFLLRPPIKRNLQELKNFSQNKNCQLFLISSRYSFLEKRTKQWLKKRGLEGIFKRIILNKKDQQPHLFKKEMVDKFQVDVFVDDDRLIVDYLCKKLPKIKVFCWDEKNNKRSKNCQNLVSSLEEILKS